MDRLHTRVGALVLVNPVICGSGEHVMTAAGIRAALASGAAGVVSKSVNESPVAAKQLDIAPKAIATIGDQPNDLRMFERSGLSIAMGNAPEEVQKRADAVTSSYDDEGFAKAVERYILEKAT